LLAITGNYLFKRFFYKKLKIEISAANLIFSIENKEKISTENILTIAKINWFCVDSINPKFYIIRFKLNGGEKVEFTLPQNKIGLGDDDPLTIIKSINNQIINYNISVTDLERIQIRPSFFATSLGLYSIIGVSGLTIITIFLNLIYSSRSRYLFTFISIVVVIQLLVKRKSSLSIYKTLEEAHIY
jgi:hypothetical protein